MIDDIIDFFVMIILGCAAYISTKYVLLVLEHGLK